MTLTLFLWYLHIATNMLWMELDESQWKVSKSRSAVHSQLRDQNAKIINVLPMTEGFFKLWRGASLNVMRAVLMTLSQVRIYYAS